MHIMRLMSLVVAGLLLLSTWPQLLGMQQLPVLAQLTALRGFLISVSAVGVVAFGLIAWRSRAWRGFGLAMVGALLIVSSLNLGLMLSRGLSPHASQGESDADLTVFTWNMYRDGPDPQIVADFAILHGVDVLSLLETSPDTAAQISERMKAAGSPVQVFVNTIDRISKSRSTVLLISRAVGEYVIDDSVGTTPRVPAVVARPADGMGPTLIAAHAAPPLPFIMRDWAGGLTWLAERCREGSVIIAGDFNATLDHFAGLRDEGADVGACRDGASSMGSAALGTWPSQVSPMMGSPIDHIVATPEWEFVEFRAVLELDGQGSDHRALLGRLRQR